MKWLKFRNIFYTLVSLAKSYLIFTFLLCFLQDSIAQNPCASPPEWEITTGFQIAASANFSNMSINVAVVRANTRNTILCRGNCSSMPSNLPTQQTSARIQIVRVGSSTPTIGTYTGADCRTSNLNWTGNLANGSVLVYNQSISFFSSTALSQIISGLQEGTYIVAVRLGTNSSHSRYQQTTVVLKRDIYPSNLLFSSSVTQGQTFTVTARDNFSGVGSNYYSSNWGIYLSTNCTFGSTDVLLASGTSSIGTSNTSATISTNVSIPAAGNFYILFVSDRNNGIAETNENNNVICSSITVNPVLRENVWLENLTVNTTNWIFGNQVIIGVRQRITTTRTYNQSIMLSYGINSICDVTGSNYKFLSNDASSIDVNNTSEVESYSFIVPRLPSGLHRLVVKADYTDLVTNESSDSDNLSCLPINIAEYHDFYIANATLSNYNPVQGSPLQVNFDHVYNGNSSTSKYAIAHIYYSSNAFLDASDRILDYKEGLFSFSNNFSSYVSNFTFPNTIPLGAGYIILKADSPDSYAEINETNNIVVIPINVQAPCVPVRANFSASPNPTNTLVRAGETVNFRDISTGSIAWNRFEWQIPNVSSSWDARNNVSSFSVRYGIPGTYSTVLRVGGCGENSTSIRFEIKPALQAVDYSNLVCRQVNFPVSSVGDPINVASGDYDLSVVDLTINTREGKIPFTRRYLSTNALSQYSSLGYGWKHNFDKSLTIQDNLITVNRGDGASAFFVPYNEISNHILPYHSFETDTMYRVGTDYYLENTSGIIEVYTSVGLWSKTIFPSGYQIQAYYGGGNLTYVDFQDGRSLTFYYTANRLNKVIDNAGRTVQYQVNTSNDLTSITSVRGHTGRYVYSNHLLTDAIDYRGDTFVKNRYNSLGQTIYQDWQGSTYLLYYNYPIANATTVVDSDGTHVYYQDKFFRTYKYVDPLNNVQETNYEIENHNPKQGKDAKGNTFITRNSEIGNTESVTLPNGAVYKAVYNNLNLPDTVINALNQKTFISWNGQRKIRQVKYANGSTISNTYYPNGQLKTFTDPLGTIYTSTWVGADLRYLDTPTGRIQFTHNAAGQLRLIIDRNNNQFAFETDYYDNLTKLTINTANGEVYVYEATYDANGNLTGEKDFNGNWKRYIYNRQDFVSEIIDKDNTRTKLFYDLQNRLKRVVDAEGNFQEFRRNAAGWVTEIEDAWGIVSISHDANGNPISTTDALGKVTTLSFDVMNNISRVTFPDNTTNSLNYNLLSMATKFTDERNLSDSTTLSSDMNWVNQVQDASNAKIGVRHNARGDIVGVKNATNDSIKYQIDAYGQTTQADYEGRRYQRRFDNEGILNFLQDANGLSCSIVHNGLGRILSKTYSNGNRYDYTKNNNGSVTAVNKNGVRTNTFTRDVKERITLATDKFNNRFGYTYNQIGQQTSFSINTTFSTTTQYYRGLVKRVSDGLGNWIDYTFNANKQLIEINYSNGVRTVITYDNRDRRSSMKHFDSNAQLIHSNVLVYNEHGFIIQDTGQPALNLSLPQYRLENYARGNDDRVTTINNATVTADANGNLLNLPSGERFSWGEENLLTSYKSLSGANVTNTYDGLMNRVATDSNGVQTRYLIDPNGLAKVVGTQDASGVIKEYYVYTPFGLGWKIKNGVAHFYHFDNSGNTVALTNSTGNVTDRYATTPFGDDFGIAANHQGTTQQPFIFSGQFGIMKDAQDFYWVRARWYKPSWGQFISKDAYPASLSNPQSWNRYSYAINAPLEFADPTGLKPKDITWYKQVQNSYNKVIDNWSWREFGGVLHESGNEFLNGFIPNDHHEVLDAFGAIPGLGEPLDLINGLLYEIEGDYFNANLSYAMAIPWAGYVALGTRITKKALTNSSEKVFKTFTSSNYRHNLQVLTETAGDGMDAHHIFPQANRFKEYWNNLDINIHDPHNLTWWESTSHRQNARAYNAAWDNFFNENINPTKNQVIEFSNYLLNKFK